MLHRNVTRLVPAPAKNEYHVSASPRLDDRGADQRIGSKHLMRYTAGKEHVLRLPRISNSPKLSRFVPVAVMAVALGMLSGCNGFLDPTAVGRFDQKPLMVKILSSLDTGV